MQTKSSFSHLKLVKVKSGAPNLSGGGDQSEKTKELKKNNASHALYLKEQVQSLKEHFVELKRQEDSEEAIPSGVPLLLKVDPQVDVEYLRTSFGFEIVSEQEDGFVIVASDDIDFKKFLKKVQGFSQGLGRTGSVAQVHEILFEPTQRDRLQRVLSEELFSTWSSIRDNDELIVDISVSCVGTSEVPKYPAEVEGQSIEKYAERIATWEEKYNTAYFTWDLLKIERENMIEAYLSRYRGEILNIVDGVQDKFELPDSLNFRIRISGRGFRDLVLNCSYLIDVAGPDSINSDFTAQAFENQLEFQCKITPPTQDAPYVCIVDSGIQEEHPLLSGAIDKAATVSLLQAPFNHGADEFPPGGHGTRVAGAVLYRDGIPRSGQYEFKSWLINARVLDNNNRLPSYLMPAAYLKYIVEKLKSYKSGVRVYNHSIGSSTPCKLTHMSIWAAAIDLLSHEHDVLFVQAAGNIMDIGTQSAPGILDMLSSGHKYPDFLIQPASRICNPAQSFSALTVGSVSHTEHNDGLKKSFARINMPSSFSRAGLGLWGSIKPEVVEYGGDNAHDINANPAISNPPDLCLELVRASVVPPSPLVDRDAVGTSYVAPKVSAIAAELCRLFPSESALFYKAMIVHSARWPNIDPLSVDSDENLQKMLKLYGYGIVNLDRALGNTNFRVTTFSPGKPSIRAREAHIYKIPVPEVVRKPGNENKIRIEVTLVYSAKPKRTRKLARRYFSTWVDWQTNALGEGLEEFAGRVLKNQPVHRKSSVRIVIPWTIGHKKSDGQLSNIRRGAGATQKDWADVRAHELPKEFLISVVGHEGWSKDPEDEANYCLIVSFEAIDGDLEIYSDIKVAIDRMTVGNVEV